MSTRLSLLAAGLCLPIALAAQEAEAVKSVVLPTPEAQIAAAVLPLPEEFRASATVLGYRVPGELITLRQGTGAMICLADNPSEARFHVACYQRDMEPFMARGRALRAQGITNVDSVRYAEVESGVLPMPNRAALWSLTGGPTSFDWATNTPDGTVRPLYVVYLPGATAESIGLPVTPGQNTPWLMFPGTPKAHIMFIPSM
ncbi:MAG TPA: hypothetical protein PLI93_09810 [Gemmatimonadales bacterium]|nr:hypothetical protein [Gemmatimonadales bacterium]HRX18918.1 hypothetical protein [Gemmatimonadales bacterium]